MPRVAPGSVAMVPQEHGVQCALTMGRSRRPCRIERWSGEITRGVTHALRASGEGNNSVLAGCTGKPVARVSSHDHCLAAMAATIRDAGVS